MHELGWWGGGTKCLIKMVYDTIPRMTAACFFFRMVFCALTAAMQSLQSTASIRLCAVSPPAHRVPAWASLAAADAGEGEGCLPKAREQCLADVPSSAGKSGLTLGTGRPEPSSVRAMQGTSSGSPALQFAPSGRWGGQRDHETMTGPASQGNSVSCVAEFGCVG